jgi:hypothetical protein
MNAVGGSGGVRIGHGGRSEWSPRLRVGDKTYDSELPA